MTSDLVANRYVLEDKLGEGGMGAVFMAYDRLQKHTVAFKQIRQKDSPVDVEGTTEHRVALAHEFQVLASLKHPHIISVIDYGFSKAREPYFTMTLLEQARPIVAHTENLSFDERIELLLQVLQALAYLHGVALFTATSSLTMHSSIRTGWSGC